MPAPKTIALFVIIGVLPMVVIMGIVFFSFGDEYADGFDHYRTDVDIVVNTDGSVTQTETYWFRWDDIRSGETYISKPKDMAGSITVTSVTVNGTVMTVPAASYNTGRQNADSTGNPQYYAGVNSSTGDYEINAFYPYRMSGDYEVTFNYTVSGAAVRYTDCVDLYYKVFDSFSEDLKNLTVTVTLPPGSLQEDTRIYGHGDPNAMSDFVDTTTGNAVFKSTNLRAWTMFEIRVVDQRNSPYTITPIRTDKDFASILAEEQKFYDDTQRAIDDARFYGNIQIALLLAMIAFVPVWLIFIRKLIFRRERPTFNESYVRDIPSHKPNTVTSLDGYYRMFGGSFSNKMTATMLDLALRKIIAIEGTGKKDLVFVSIDGNAPMTGFEKGVYNLLFRSAGGGKRITLEEVRRSAADPSYGSTDLFSIDRKEFDRHGFVNDGREVNDFLVRGLPCLIVFSMIATIGFLSVVSDNSNIVIFAMFGGFVLMVILSVLSGTRKPLTLEGENERAKVKALKRFYTDMTLMKERRSVELSVWEKHLVYATALGVADQVIKELDVRILEITDPSLMQQFVYLNVLSRTGDLSGTFSSLRTAALAAYASGDGGFSRGGGSGGGGGFSGGGGGGFGGGGGGHR